MLLLCLTLSRLKAHVPKTVTQPSAYPFAKLL